MQPIIARKEVTQHILRTFGIRASKRLGQNFLIDPRVVAEIVAAAEIRPGDRVLEIGPGIGTLTQGLAEAGAEVLAVEIDDRLLPILSQTVGCYGNVRILHGDILKVDISREMEGQPFKVVANLPYYITTPIIMGLLEQKLPIERLVTMVQKEVADRMTAQPGGKDYGALSVAVQYHTVPQIAMTVPPGSFLPAPEVESAVICCRVRTAPPVDLADEKTFFRVVKAGFAQRRKTLNNTLRSAGLSAEQVRTMLSVAGIDGGRRGETLSLQEFAALANAWSAMK